MASSGRSGNSARRVLGSGVGNRAFSGFPTITSSRGSHSLQLQTRDILDPAVSRQPGASGLRALETEATSLRVDSDQLPDGAVRAGDLALVEVVRLGGRGVVLVGVPQLAPLGERRRDDHELEVHVLSG